MLIELFTTNTYCLLSSVVVAAGLVASFLRRTINTVLCSMFCFCYLNYSGMEFASVMLETMKESRLKLEMLLSSKSISR